MISDTDPSVVSIVKCTLIYCERQLWSKSVTETAELDRIDVLLLPNLLHTCAKHVLVYINEEMNDGLNECVVWFIVV